MQDQNCVWWRQSWRNTRSGNARRALLDLAITAADKYAMSLLPGGLKGNGLRASSDGGPPKVSGSPTPKHPGAFVPKGTTPPRRGVASSSSRQHAASAAPPQLDAQMVDSWDSNLKEILSALEPDGKSSIKPVRVHGVGCAAHAHTWGWCQACRWGVITTCLTHVRLR